MTASEKKQISEAYIKEQGKLRNWIRKRIKDEFEAEDILQDVFYQLTVGFKEIRVIDNLTAWLYKVAGNRIRDNFRKKKIRNPVSKDNQLHSGEDSASIADLLPAHVPDPEDEDLREIIWEEIRTGLKEIPEEQAEVFILHEFEDKSFKEISALTGQSINTLISRKHYAVLYLREKLKPLYKLINS